ncbi:MAG: efflux RND transporter periplasmic adaptor subunit [Aquificaceae bacterium]
MKRLLALACLAVLLSCAKDEKKAQTAPTEISVSVYRLKSENVETLFETKGFFESQKDVTLKPEISSKVIEILVEEGQAVKRGQALVKLDSSDFQKRLSQLNAELMRIKAHRENLEAIANRRKMLFERELISREEFERASTEVKLQQEAENSILAQIEAVRLDISRSIIRAPFDGYVAKRFVSLGDYVSPQSQVIRVVNLNPVDFVFQVPQESLEVLKQNSEVKITSEPFGEYTGKVFFISPVADQNRLITIKARVENPKAELRPGMFGQVRVPTGFEQAFAIPERAIIVRGTRKIVWKIENNVASLVEVKIVKKEGSVSYVQGNLKEGDLIAIENAYALQQGKKVIVR